MWTKIIPSTEANVSKILPKMGSKCPKYSMKINNCIEKVESKLQASEGEKGFGYRDKVFKIFLVVTFQSPHHFC